MPKQIVIAEQLRIAAVLSDERVDELIVAQGRYQIGDVYLGTVENVLPGIDAAFVNIGESEKNGFIHVTDLGPLRLKKGAETDFLTSIEVLLELSYCICSDKFHSIKIHQIEKSPQQL